MPKSLKFRSLALITTLLFSLPVLAQLSPGNARKLTVKECFSIYPNLVSGHIGRSSENMSRAIAQKSQELEGLSYSAVLPWVPRRRDAVHRFFIEKLGVKNPMPLPLYDKAQKVGKARMNLKDIRFSQRNCRNMSQDKKYSVVGNARSFRDGTLKPEQLPTIKVWRDTEGRVWTLDHRRLAAMRLSGVIDEIEVEFVSEAIVQAQKFKFGTQTEGKSMMIHLDEPEATEKLAIVLINE